jgi:hypothetical protein
MMFIGLETRRAIQAATKRNNPYVEPTKQVTENNENNPIVVTKIHRITAFKKYFRP